MDDETEELRQFAKNLTTLPDLPESVRSIAQTYIQTGKNLKNVPSSISNAIFRNSNNLSSVGALSNVGANTSRNLEQNQQHVNRSYSLKNFQDLSGIGSQASPNKISARVKELAGEHLRSQDQISKSIQNQNGDSAPYMNLNSIKGFSKNIIVTQNALPMSKLSPLPDRYKQHLPNIIKKKINEATASTFNFNLQASQLTNTVSVAQTQAPNAFQPGNQSNLKYS